MTRSGAVLCVLCLLAPAAGQAARFDCPAAPLVAASPNAPAFTWSLQPATPTSLEFSAGRLVCRYGKTVMSLTLTPRQCVVQADGGRIARQGEVTSCAFNAGAARPIADQCYLECR